VVGAGLERPAFSTLDAMASTVRKEVNASICTGIHDRMSAVERAGLLRLLEERDADGTTQDNRLKKSAQSPTWSHFKRLNRPNITPMKVRRAGDGLRSQGFKIIVWPLSGLPRRSPGGPRRCPRWPASC
jgi:hypothetical protein